MSSVFFLLASIKKLYLLFYFMVKFKKFRFI